MDVRIVMRFFEDRAISALQMVRDMRGPETHVRVDPPTIRALGGYAVR